MDIFLGGHNCCLSGSLTLLVGFSTKDEAVDVARSAPQVAYYCHADWEQEPYGSPG